MQKRIIAWPSIEQPRPLHSYPTYRVQSLGLVCTAASSMVFFNQLESLEPAKDKSHHTSKSSKSFKNPWPSFPDDHLSLTSALKTRFFDKKPPFVPVPLDRVGLVQVNFPDFASAPDASGYKVIWIGHASFLVQFYFLGGAGVAGTRSLNVLLDPVFSERTSPVTFMGPKRYTPTPCTLSELLEAVPIDVVCISHNHYDHADKTTLKAIYDHQAKHDVRTVFCVALGNPRWLTSFGIPPEHIWEADWWDRIAITGTKEAVGDEGNTVRITCTPSQHGSARGVRDSNCDLWCSWSFEMDNVQNVHNGGADMQNGVSKTVDHNGDAIGRAKTKSLFFAGDTGYRAVPLSMVSSPSEIDKLPVCPTFAQVGSILGPFDLALLPIGLNRPRHFMSPVHVNAKDSMDIHRDICSKKSIGMHWGTVRGGISAYYEDVKDPPKEWEEEARKAGKIWRDRQSKREKKTLSTEDWEIGLLDIGESLFI